MSKFKSFITRFTRKGLLYYGIAFFAGIITLNGIFSPFWSLRGMLWGAVLGILALGIYDLTLMIGEKRSSLLTAIYTVILCLLTVSGLLVSTVFIPKSHGISFVPQGISDSLVYYLFGTGFESASNGCLFLQAIKVGGFLGLLAILTHFKHLLEVAIRRFSPARLLIILLCLGILFCPLGSLDILSAASLISLYCLFA